MKFTCETSLLTEAVTNVSRVIPGKSSIPALEGVQIKAYGSSLELTGYDMESGIKTTLGASIQREGEIVLSARLLSDMLRKMKGDVVSIESDEKYRTQIQCGMTEFTILGMPSEEFPELPQIEGGEGMELSQATLKSMLEQILFAVATIDTKPVHTGALFDIRDEKLFLVAVDGYRLAMRTAPLPGAPEQSFVVPGKVLGELCKLMKEDEEEKASLMVSKRHIVFQVGKYNVVSRLLEGEFLDYKGSIPQGVNATVYISTRSFIESVERVSLLISDRLRSPVRILFEKEEIRLSCSTPLGKSFDVLSCKSDGDAQEIGFNNKYLLDALKAADCDEVRLELNGPLSPVKVLPPVGEDFLFLVLPVRLKNEA